MTFLVTGGTGVIGAYVVRRLLELGDEVVATSSRGDATLLGASAADVRLERCDVRDAGAMQRLLDAHRPEVVIHLAAALPALCSAEPALAVELNVTATAALYAMAARQPVRRFVYASTKSAYGPDLPFEHGPPQYAPIPEELPPRPLWMYDVTKYAGELVLTAGQRSGGPEVVSLRFATIYGPGKGGRHAGAAGLSRLIEAAIYGEEFRLAQGGDQVDDVIWVGDAAEGIVRVARAERPLHPLYNIASGTGIAIRDFAAAVAVAYPEAPIEIGPGLRYMGDEPTYGVLDITRAGEDLDFGPDPDPARGIELYAAGLEELARSSR
ncbi:MAG TPA: NAD-dependent epimerase/dehydratase family protein [Thermoleophilaceae bacterium]|jgi:UDP-glucose 4-epimerase